METSRASELARLIDCNRRKSRRVGEGSKTPSPNTRELVAYLWLSEVTDMEEAVAWVKCCPNPMAGPSEIEIRPIGEGDDRG